MPSKRPEVCMWKWALEGLWLVRCCEAVEGGLPEIGWKGVTLDLWALAHSLLLGSGTERQGYEIFYSLKSWVMFFCL